RKTMHGRPRRPRPRVPLRYNHMSQNPVTHESPIRPLQRVLPQGPSTASGLRGRLPSARPTVREGEVPTEPVFAASIYLKEEEKRHEHARIYRRVLGLQDERALSDDLGS